MGAVGLIVLQPGVGRAHKVLVLDVDEVLRVPDVLHVGLRDGGVHQAALLAVEELGAGGVQDGRVGGDGAEELTKKTTHLLHNKHNPQN